MPFFCGACCKWGCHLYTTTAPLCCIAASYCHLSTTLQTISITVVTLQIIQLCSNFYRTFNIFIELSLILVAHALTTKQNLRALMPQLNTRLTRLHQTRNIWTTKDFDKSDIEDRI